MMYFIDQQNGLAGSNGSFAVFLVLKRMIDNQKLLCLIFARNEQSLVRKMTDFLLKSNTSVRDICKE